MPRNRDFIDAQACREGNGPGIPRPTATNQVYTNTPALTDTMKWS